MKIEHLKITKNGQTSIIEINGENAERVLDYDVQVSAYGDSELNITFDISDASKDIEVQDIKNSNKLPIPIILNGMEVT